MCRPKIKGFVFEAMASPIGTTSVCCAAAAFEKRTAGGNSAGSLDSPNYFSTQFRIVVSVLRATFFFYAAEDG